MDNNKLYYVIRYQNEMVIREAIFNIINDNYYINNQSIDLKEQATKSFQNILETPINLETQYFYHESNNKIK
jgi:hypothetical protein